MSDDGIRLLNPEDSQRLGIAIRNCPTDDLKQSSETTILHSHPGSPDFVVLVELAALYVYGDHGAHNVTYRLTRRPERT